MTNISTRPYNDTATTHQIITLEEDGDIDSSIDNAIMLYKVSTYSKASDSKKLVSDRNISTNSKVTRKKWRAKRAQAEETITIGSDNYSSKSSAL